MAKIERTKIVFMGSPAFAVPSLQALAAAGHEMVCVYTQPPRPAGRGMKLQRTAVHEAADGLGLAVRHPERLKGAELDAVLELDAEVFCVVAYGLLLPKVLVESRVCLNVHPSALPQWRGAAPLQWTLMSGATRTEVCVMRLDAGMDTGPVVCREAVAIPADMTYGELHDGTAEVGARLLAEVLDRVSGPQDIRVAGIAQVGETTHAAKITAEVRVIDWGKSAAEVHNLVRGLSPLPGATARLGGETFKVIRTDVVEKWAHKVIGEAGAVLGVDEQGVMVACGTGAVRISEMQRAGGKAGRASEIARGWPELKAGVRLA